MRLRFGTSGDERRIGALAALWEQARAVSTHPASCKCGGRMGLETDPRILEDSVLEELHILYDEAGAHRLTAVIAGRRGALMAPAGAGPFTQWLETMAALPDAERARLVTDMERVLRSVVQMDRDGLRCY